MPTTFSDNVVSVTAPGQVRLRSIDVRDFRNIAHVELDVPAGGLVLIGDNGQGKTSFLEAVHYLEVLRSMRGARDAELIRFGAAAFHVGATIEFSNAGAMEGGATAAAGGFAAPAHATRRVGVGFARAGRRKKVTLDDVEVARLSDALGAVPSVVVSPRDVALVAGAPSERRRFVDIALALTRPRYLRALQGYRAALARRNAALRHGGHPESAAAVWEPAMAEHGAVLWMERRQWVDAVRERASDLALAIGEDAPLALRYESTLGPAAAAPAATGEASASGSMSADTEAGAREALERALADKRPLDARRGLTHTGPHRDDLEMLLGGRSLRAFGSAGQQRSAALVLRLLEAFTLHEALGRHPLMLLDDPFAELDERRAARVLTLLATDTPGQVLFAVPRAADVPEAMHALPRYVVRGGAIARLGGSGG